jgi:hypothetical protein
MEGQRGVAMTYGKPLTYYHCDYGDHWHVCKVENHLRNRLGESCIDKAEPLL